MKLFFKNSRSAYLFFVVAVSFFITSNSAFAAYQLDKVRLFLSRSNSIETIKITNTGTNPINIQAQVFTWTVTNGEDVLQPSSDLIVSPPIMKIPGNKSQLMRVGWRQPAQLASEKAYRLFIQEITPEKPLEQTGVRVRLKLGVPVFILPTNPKYQLNWESQGLSGNNFKVKVTNTGNVHIKLSTTDLVTSAGKVAGTFNSSIYIFPGQSTTINFNMNETGTKNLNIVANTDHQTMRSQITLP